MDIKKIKKGFKFNIPFLNFKGIGLGKDIGLGKGMGLGLKRKSANASPQRQQQWKDMSLPNKIVNRTLRRDSDRDGVPNRYDCRPHNSRMHMAKWDAEKERSYKEFMNKQKELKDYKHLRVTLSDGEQDRYHKQMYDSFMAEKVAKLINKLENKEISEEEYYKGINNIVYSKKRTEESGRELKKLKKQTNEL